MKKVALKSQQNPSFFIYYTVSYFSVLNNKKIISLWTCAMRRKDAPSQDAEVEKKVAKGAGEEGPITQATE